MTNIVLLGGNGYIGRNVTEKWLAMNKNAEFYVLSRSGKNSLTDKRIHNLKVDVTDVKDVLKAIPESVDYIVNFVGAPSNNETEFENLNTKPVKVMLETAKIKSVKCMGFIGGTLGSKKFTDTKRNLSQMLLDSGIPTAIVEPTVVYGNGRNDALAKMIPLFKLLGFFNKNMKPVHVNAVTDELLNKLLEENYENK